MPAAAGKIYLSGDVEIDTARVAVRRGGEERNLRPKTFRLLVYLIEHRARLVPKEELIEQLWPGIAVSDGALAQCVSDIRRALNEDPRHPKFIRTAARLGYQFIGPLDEKRSESVILEEITEERVEYSEEVTEEDEPAELDFPPARLLPPPRGRRGWRFALPISLAGLAVVVALALSRLGPQQPAGSMDAGIRTAVIPFENRSGKADLNWLRGGLADMLATDLSGSPRISLITQGQLQRELRTSSAASITHDDALRAARQAGARVMITGAFASLGDSVRVDVQIYDVSSGRMWGGESLSVEQPALLLARLDPLATKLAARLGAPSGGQHLAEVMTDNLEAYRLYSLGLERTWNLRLPEAIEFYRKAVALDPGFAMAYARIGFTYSSTWARPDEGKPYLEKAYRLSDRLTPRDRLYIRAWYAVACRDYQAAERGYREILSAFPLEIEIYHALGTLLLGDRRYSEARQILERGREIKPDMPQFHNMLSFAYFGLGEREKAVQSAQKYVALTDEPNAYDTLAEAYYRIGRHDEARAAYLEAIHRKPDFEIAIIHLGNLYFQLGRYREALQQYAEYIRLAPSNGERVRGHISSSWVYWKRGDLTNAAREAAEATRLNGGHEVRDSLPVQADRGGLALTGDLHQWIFLPGANRGARENRRIPYFVAGYVGLRDHKTNEALDHFRAALGEPPVYWYVDPLETCLADALFELGRLDEAIVEYRRVLGDNPNYPIARYRLGLALDRKGLKSEARPEFQRFLAIWKNADVDVPEFVHACRRMAE
ncbi:MAG: tetratricopeptide repeat protein [Acidobacteriaceae bacterium]|nr:tetratricopeptide repeat protein [Acidobacteriaceae bacterium]